MCQTMTDIRNVSDEVLFEVLTSWEEWTGDAKEFYRSIGFSHRQGNRNFKVSLSLSDAFRYRICRG